MNDAQNFFYAEASYVAE